MLGLLGRGVMLQGMLLTNKWLMLQPILHNGVGQGLKLWMACLRSLSLAMRMLCD